MTTLARLTALAQELIVRVRDEDPEANARWLALGTTPEAVGAAVRARRRGAG